MIADRTPFHVVAGIVGAIAGEILAGVLAVASARILFEPRATLLPIAALLVTGTIAGACGGVVLLRRWLRQRGYSTGG